MARFYCICVFWNTSDADQSVSISLDWNHTEGIYPQMIWLKYEAINVNQTNIDDLVRLGIDNNCQVKRFTQIKSLYSVEGDKIR